MDARDARRLRDIIVDCTHPAALARFWALALGWPSPRWDEHDMAQLASLGVTDPEHDPFVFIDSGEPHVPRLGFQRVPERKVAKNRVHLDVNVNDPDAVDAWVAAGATVVRRCHGGEGRHDWLVMLDPEGNEFCASLLV